MQEEYPNPWNDPNTAAVLTIPVQLNIAYDQSKPLIHQYFRNLCFMAWDELANHIFGGNFAYPIIEAKFPKGTDYEIKGKNQDRLQGKIRSFAFAKFRELNSKLPQCSSLTIDLEALSVSDTEYFSSAILREYVEKIAAELDKYGAQMNEALPELMAGEPSAATKLTHGAHIDPEDVINPLPTGAEFKEKFLHPNLSDLLEYCFRFNTTMRRFNCVESEDLELNITSEYVESAVQSSMIEMERVLFERAINFMREKIFGKADQEIKFNLVRLSPAHVEELLMPAIVTALEVNDAEAKQLLAACRTKNV